MTHNTSSTWRRRARLTILAALPVFALAPMASRAFGAEVADVAEPGPGTDLVKCNNQAWSDYNKCLVGATFKWEKAICDLAFEADELYCATIYYKLVHQNVSN